MNDQDGTVILASDIEQPFEHCQFTLSAKQVPRVDVPEYGSFSFDVRGGGRDPSMLHDVSRKVSGRSCPLMVWV